MINIRLSWPPSVNRCYRTYRGRYLLSAVGRQYKKDAVVELIVQKAPKGLTTRLEVNIDAYPPDKRKRDLDNLTKILLDVLEDYGIYVNDEQIDILRIRRMSVVKSGYVRVYITEIDEV